MNALVRISAGSAPTTIASLDAKPYNIDYSGPYATGIHLKDGKYGLTITWGEVILDFWFTDPDQCDTWADLFMRARTMMEATP